MSTLDYFIWWSPFIISASIPYTSLPEYITPLVVVSMIYIATIFLAKWKNDKKDYSEISKKSFIPIIVYTILAVISYIAFFVPMPLFTMVDMVANNILLCVLWAYVYKWTFNKTF